MAQDPPVRNGTSQRDRIQRALDPDYVFVDERSIEDLLAFAHGYAAELRYFNTDNQPAGEWSEFLVPAGRQDVKAFLGEVAAFAETPEAYVGKENVSYTRPHVVLFLTFLNLLQQARKQLNDLTRRHLEFYYREALRLTAKPAVADRVHVLVEPAAGQTEYLLPAGTLLFAGQDSQGADLFYQTDQNLLANQAQVASVKSLFVHKKVSGIRDVHQDYRLLKNLPIYESFDGLQAEDSAFMAMLAMALGDPDPGDRLPPYPSQPEQPLTPSLLSRMDALLAFIQNSLCMTLPAFRTLMDLKRKQAGQIWDRNWEQVNELLKAAGTKRDARFAWAFAAPTDFETNWKAALGLGENDVTKFFATLPEVNDIYDLYRLKGRKDRRDITDFIEQKMHMSADDFTDMMKFVDDVYKDWRQIYDILRAAGKKRKPLPANTGTPPQLRAGGYDSKKFALLVAQTLEPLDFGELGDKTIGDLDACYTEVQKLEAYFHMPAESFASVRNIQAKGREARSWEWEQAYEAMEKAYAAKSSFQRREALKARRAASGFEAMLVFALGDPEPGDNLPGNKDFKELIAETDASYIREQLYLEVENFKYVKSTSENPNATDAEWAAVCQILELAQRRKRKPQARIETWENIYAAADATDVAVQPGLEKEAAAPRWRTFGASPSSGEGAQPAAIGMAIASPILALAEGERTIKATLVFNESGFDLDAIRKTITDCKNRNAVPFRFFLSTREKMVEVIPKSMVSSRTKQKPALMATLQLDRKVPPVEALTVDAGIPLPATPWPILQIMVSDVPEMNDQIHRAFHALQLERLTLDVSVAGLTQLTLQSDDGVLDAKKPFEPFGFSPVAGSSFAIAHPELCSKRLDTLSMEVDWMGAPDDFNNYYENYRNRPANNTSFKATLSLYDNRTFLPVTAIQLFNADPDPKDLTKGAGKTNEIDISRIDIPTYQAELRPVTSDEVLNWSRYWKVELLPPDLQHAAYPREAATNAQEMADARAKKSNDNTIRIPAIINPPYTPKIKRLSMGYSASVTIDPAEPATIGRASGTALYHLEPFGYREIVIETTKDQQGQDRCFFSPPDILPQYENEGELFIGMKDLVPPRNLALLIQIAEGSADPDAALEAVRWDYLTGNQWKSLEAGHVLSDRTNGWRNSGIVAFDVPPVEPSTRMPAGLYWMRATIARNSRSVGDTVAIRAQAVSATYKDQGNAPDHLDRPLPPERIAGLANPLPEVKAIHQPYSSIDGKGPEQANRFYTRVSERLRHKNRALSSWDYERMVLESFPGIYKVKCLPVGTTDDPRQADVIRLIVIPDIRDKVPFDPFAPKVPADTLENIRQFLLRCSSPFARFEIKNPSFAYLTMRLGVRFRQGYNSGYATQALNQELQRYLAPWAYDRSVDVVLGGMVNANLIVHFVEERPYVDYVAGIKLFVSSDPGMSNPQQVDNKYRVDPDAILISSREFQIDVITGEGFEEEFFTGIDYMKIEWDFKVA